MKKWALVLSFVAIFATSGLVYVSAQEAAKPEKGVVVGTAISIANFAMKGAGVEGEAEAAKYHAEKGFPVGILDDESGEIYICVYRDNAPASHLEPANEVMLEYMGTKVAAQGLIYKAKGVNVLRIGVISEY